MTRARGYHVLSLLTCLGGGLILLTEVRERIESALTLQSVIEVKEKLTDESLSKRERGLLMREQELTSLLSGTGTEVDRSESGVIEFVHAAARRHGVEVESIMPALERRVDGHLTELPISIMARGSFQALGGFIGEMENGPFLFHVEKCELTCDDVMGRGLMSRIESTAVIIGGRS